MIKLCAFADEADSALIGQIAALKKNGISLIELRGIDGKNISVITEEEAKAAAALLAENGIRVWSLGSPIGKIKLSDDFEAHKDMLRHLCRLAKIFGTDKMRVFSFYEAYEDEKTVFSRLREMVAIAAEMGVTLYHENEKAIYGDVLSRVKRIFENVEGLSLVYDPANFLEVGESADVTLPALHAKADYFHIKDVVAETRQLVPAGYGDGNIAELVRRIGKDDEKVLTLEPHLKVFAGYADIDGTEMKNRFCFESNAEAFDAAVAALKDVLAKEGYREENGVFVKA